MLNTANIEPSWLDQFAKETMATNDNYGITYDYGSIMHYGALSASKNGKPSMVPYDRKYIETLGSHFVSFYELLMLNTHYKCLDKCKADRSAAKCKMGGFPHPRDCSKCICPSGYGGKLCDQKPTGCGSILNAGEKYQNAGRYGRKSFCRNIRKRGLCEMLLLDTDGVALDGCPYAGVEIKTQADQRMTGYRYASPSFCINSSNNSGIIVNITVERYKNR
ncbi:astacin [Oesophagostomum dentatum]|uniref:Astacin n=1 Tax=Oesophagostomum dentatum TaxID=61180 RepID=A0A0B1SSP8_OESDE|nr:astacin [Oesophagostomum dentatum]